MRIRFFTAPWKICLAVSVLKSTTRGRALAITKSVTVSTVMSPSRLFLPSSNFFRRTTAASSFTSNRANTSVLDVMAKEAIAFATAADANEEVLFAITSNTDVFALFEVNDDAAVVLLKKFDEGRNNLEGDITVETVTDFVI